MLRSRLPADDFDLVVIAALALFATGAVLVMMGLCGV